MGARLRYGLALLAGLALSGCEMPTSPRPEARIPPPAAPEAPLPSEASLELAKYYANVQRNLLTQGLLRVDGGGPDTPYNKRQVVDNFIQIGVFNEFTQIGSTLANTRSEGRVQRWTKPVQLSLQFSGTVPQNKREKDRQFVSRFAERLARQTGQRITSSRGRGNFHVAVLDVDDLAGFAPKLQGLIPGMSDALAAEIIDMPRSIYCAVYAFPSVDEPDVFHRAVAIVRAEHPDLLRQTCYHEEITQGLGLSNDSPDARPSIFNDDNEFAYLTSHDELLLQILYDDRLPLGATPSAARPVVEVLAAELFGGES